MHQDNKIRNPHNENTAMRRAEIAIRFDVAEEEASQNFMDALIGSLKRDLKKDLGAYNPEVEGKWL